MEAGATRAAVTLVGAVGTGAVVAVVTDADFFFFFLVPSESESLEDPELPGTRADA